VFLEARKHAPLVMAAKKKQKTIKKSGRSPFSSLFLLLVKLSLIEMYVVCVALNSLLLEKSQFSFLFFVLAFAKTGFFFLVLNKLLFNFSGY